MLLQALSVTTALRLCHQRVIRAQLDMLPTTFFLYRPPFESYDRNVLQWPPDDYNKMANSLVYKSTQTFNALWAEKIKVVPGLVKSKVCGDGVARFYDSHFSGCQFRRSTPPRHYSTSLSSMNGHNFTVFADRRSDSF